LAIPRPNQDVTPLRDNLVALYDMLIAPIEPEIADKHTVAFIPTGLLYYLPIHALAKKQGDNLRFFVEDKQIVYLTAADVMRVVQHTGEAKQPGGLVAFGDPTGAGLPGAREEVHTIAKIFPAAQALSGAQVTKTAVSDPGNLNKRVVHFATHGILNAKVPDQSYIQLAQGGKPDEAQLSVGEVWDLPLKKVDLVTLSACETALGEGEPDGGEITTIAEAFSSAGAQTVLASLWSVADDSTRDLMVEFYGQLAAGKSKAAALQAAEIKVMKDPKFAHPFYWAPFVLMGDWR
jgi:CHAT domain-containing protein